MSDVFNRSLIVCVRKAVVEDIAANIVYPIAFLWTIAFAYPI